MLTVCTIVSPVQQDGVGMHGRLVDGEGYPRADIDVYAVRTARHRIICGSSKRDDQPSLLVPSCRSTQ